MKKLLLTIIVILLSLSGTAQQPDEFLTHVYDKLHDSPMQQKFKKINPVPAGVVNADAPWPTIISLSTTEKQMRLFLNTKVQPTL